MSVLYKYLPIFPNVMKDNGKWKLLTSFFILSMQLIAPRCGCGGKPSSSYCPNRAASQDCYDPASGQLGAFSSNIEMSGMDGQFGVRSQCD